MAGPDDASEILVSAGGDVPGLRKFVVIAKQGLSVQADVGDPMIADLARRTSGAWRWAVLVAMHRILLREVVIDATSTPITAEPAHGTF